MDNSKAKKKSQLGMDPGTAQNRLLKDILWNFIQKSGDITCCKCGDEMTRETFSIEHLHPWLDSHDPVGLFFDMQNIGFSHLKCNLAAARKNTPKYSAEEAAERVRQSKRNYWTPERRKAHYEKTGR